MATLKLKKSGVCRVFMSSPFGGYEAEREELVDKYIPQLSHMCQSKGLQFVVVDLRWGITPEASLDAQVLKICLQEVDRSDIFLGMFGERYGWNGVTDKDLQQNIEQALPSYPWLKTAKDRSVTEMEYMHGYLNKPGRIPAIFAFRDKAYDDAKRVEAEQKNDKKGASKFTVESEFARQKLTVLKGKVLKSKGKCLALEINYKTPEEGAKFVFEKLRDYLNEILATQQPVNDKRAFDTAHHDAHLASRGAIYLGGSDLMKQLDAAVKIGGQQILIVGPNGCGKGALLAHWLTQLKKKKTKHYLVYHAVGCASDSASVYEILRRLIVEFHHLLGDVKKSKKDRLSEDDLKPTSTELTDIYSEMELVLEKAASKHTIILAIDGLSKVEKLSRSEKVCFWLPDHIPKNVTLIGTCREQHIDVIEELMSRGYTQMKVTELSRPLRKDLCETLLKHNSKELSKTQLEKIVDAKQIANPLYLKTVISELCAFGNFRQLTEKINKLITCENVSELFQVFLLRLEERYVSDEKRGNMIEQVMCSIGVSSKGLSEWEIMTMHKISSHEWSPLFFAMQHVMIEIGGLIRFGYREFRDAVEQRYLQDKNTKLKYQKILVNYFDMQRKSFNEHVLLDDTSLLRPAAELPWLLQAMDDKVKLMEVLQDMPIFCRLFMDQDYELVQLWHATGLKGNEIADIYLNAIEKKGEEIKKMTKERTDVQSMISITITYLGAVIYCLEMAHFQEGQEKVLNVQMKLMKESMAETLDKNENKHLSVLKLKLAYIYVEAERFKEAETMHNDVLETKREILAIAKTEEDVMQAKRGLGKSYHGIGMMKSKMGNVTDAIEWYYKALEIQKELHGDSEVADSLHNIGVMYMKLDAYDKALELCTKSKKIYDELHFAKVPPAMGVMIGNIALCYRKLGQIEEAEKEYKKAMEIIERSAGRKHPNFVFNLMNLAVLEVNRQHYEQAEEYLKTSLDILQNSESTSESTDVYKCLEKYVYVLVKLKRDDDVKIYFDMMYDIAKKKNQFDTCWELVYVDVVDWLMEKEYFTHAHDVTVALLSSKKADQKNYIQYNKICQAMKIKPNPKFDLNKAVEKKPASLSLLKNLIESKFIPSGELNKMLKALDNMNHERKIGAILYENAAVWCREAKRPELMEGVLEHALTMFPDEMNLISCLTQRHYEQQEWDKVMVLCARLREMEPDNVNHYMMHGDVALKLKDLKTARKIFKEILTRFPKMDKFTSQAKEAVEKIDSVTKGTSRTS